MPLWVSYRDGLREGDEICGLWRETRLSPTTPECQWRGSHLYLLDELLSLTARPSTARPGQWRGQCLRDTALSCPDCCWGRESSKNRNFVPTWLVCSLLAQCCSGDLHVSAARPSVIYIVDNRLSVRTSLFASTSPACHCLDTTWALPNPRGLLAIWRALSSLSCIMYLCPASSRWLRIIRSICLSLSEHR